MVEPLGDAAEVADPVGVRVHVGARDRSGRAPRRATTCDPADPQASPASAGRYTAPTVGTLTQPVAHVTRAHCWRNCRNCWRRFGVSWRRRWGRLRRSPTCGRRRRGGRAARRARRPRRRGPSSITTMRSARRAVCRRCAMRIVVRPCAATPIAACTLASVCRSRFDVASSSNRIAGSTRCARASAMSWRCPDDNDRPRSLTHCR